MGSTITGGSGGGGAPGLGIINFRGKVRFKWDRLSPGGLGGGGSAPA